MDLGLILRRLRFLIRQSSTTPHRTSELRWYAKHDTRPGYRLHPEQKQSLDTASLHWYVL